jgi:hypothetical protein
MKRVSRREQILLGACILALLWVGLPLLWDWFGGGAPSAAVSAERLRAARQQRATEAAELARLERQMHRVAHSLPVAALPAQMMAALDHRARADGIALREVRPQLAQPLDGITGVPLQVTFSAPFPRAARFLTHLRVAPDGLAVDRVVIAAGTTDTDQVTVQARVMAFSLVRERLEANRG